MGTKPKILLIQEYFTALQQRKMDSVLDMLSDEFVALIGGASGLPFTGVYRGKTGFEKHFEIFDQLIEVQEFKPKQFIVHGDEVIVEGYSQNRVRGTDTTYETGWTIFFSLNKGKIVRLRHYFDTASAMTALKSSKSTS